MPSTISSGKYEKYNQRAIDCLRARNEPLDGRVGAVKRWLDHYKVFQGFTGEERIRLANAVLRWADDKDLNLDLASTEEVLTAHTELEEACCKALGRDRGFTSLASKALWLCYPNSVPIFDDLTKRSLQMLTRLEPALVIADLGLSEYQIFVHYWKQLYERYGDTLRIPLAERDSENTLHRTKIFDSVLWLLGEPVYGNPHAES
jgi:hypothetical protein